MKLRPFTLLTLIIPALAIAGHFLPPGWTPDAWVSWWELPLWGKVLALAAWALCTVFFHPKPPPAAPLIAVLAIFNASLLLQARAYTGDALHWLGYAPLPGHSFREPLVRAVWTWFFTLPPLQSWMENAPGVLGYLVYVEGFLRWSGQGAVWIASLLACWLLRTTAKPLVPAWFLGVTSYGFLQMAFGHLEVYPWFLAAEVLFLAAAARCVVQGRGWFLAGVLSAVMTLTHLSGAFLLAGFGMWVLARQRHRKSLAGFWGGALMTLFFLGSHLFPQVGWGTFQAFFADTVGTESGWLTAWEMLSPPHLWHLGLNLLLLSPPLALLPLVFIGPDRFRLRKVGTAGEMLFFTLAPYLIWTLCWRQALGFAEDWDLFSGAALPLGWLVGLLLLQRFPKPGRLTKPIALGLLLNCLQGAPQLIQAHPPPAPPYPGFFLLHPEKLLAQTSPAVKVHIQTNSKVYRQDGPSTMVVTGEIQAQQDTPPVTLWIFLKKSGGPALFYDYILTPSIHPFDRSRFYPANSHFQQKLYERQVFPPDTLENDHFFDLFNLKYGEKEFSWWLAAVDGTGKVLAADRASFTRD